VEQSASRLLPLTQVYRHLQVLDPGAKSAVRLRDRIAHHRLRLARMAGPEARFGWWGNQTENDPFLTAYAYFADYQALKALGIQPRPGHWDKLLEVYRDSADALPLLHRVLILWLARDMGLPVKTLVDGAIDQAIGAQAEADQAPPAADASLVLEAGDAGPGQDLALVLLRNLAQGSAGHAGAKALATLAEAARKRLEQQASPLAQRPRRPHPSAGGTPNSHHRPGPDSAAGGAGPDGTGAGGGFAAGFRLAASSGCCRWRGVALAGTGCAPHRPGRGPGQAPPGAIDL
jgi:uncharacterized protein YfaS (alpha-2-macroglobulin family)